jgi:tetratricopeptide (TPR) repeat protein
MRLLAWMLLFCVGLVAFAQENSSGNVSVSDNKLFTAASGFFSQGKYQSTIEELRTIENNHQGNKEILGISAYWKGICYSRLQEFNEAVKSFDIALGLNYAPVDIHYEYGQALFAIEKLSESRLQFRESVKKKFKRGVSLYYIGFISKEMGEINKAFTFYKSINKLSDKEANEVRQAAEMQIGDIYLDQTEKRSDAFKTVETFVIPQYKKALDVDDKSSLAPIIKEKIAKLQRKYDLVLFQLRNGRPTLVPPYFIRLSQEIGQDTNVTFSPAETTISKSKQSSLFSRTDFIGRYTFYIDDIFSISPELRFNNTYYFNRVPEIYRNDNYLIAPAVRTAYEHTLWMKPASFLIDYEYGEARRDVNAEEELVFNSRTHTFMIGERFNYFSGESVVRFKYRLLDSYLSDSNSRLMSLIFEQVKPLSNSFLLFYLSYDHMRVENNIFDTNSLTFRTDYIMPRIRDWFTPSVGLSMTTTDPINNRSQRGRELLLNPNARISKSFKKNWRMSLKYDFQKNNSNDEDQFAYQKSTFGLELEYLF